MEEAKRDRYAQTVQLLYKSAVEIQVRDEGHSWTACMRKAIVNTTQDKSLSYERMCRAAMKKYMSAPELYYHARDIEAVCGKVTKAERSQRALDVIHEGMMATLNGGEDG